jgi:hypothetical protein
MTSVLSFDIGLRNLAAAVVRAKPGWEWPPECRAYASDTETADQFHARTLQTFLTTPDAWEIVQWRVMDVTGALDRTVKNVKRLDTVSKAVAVTDTLEALETEWFAGDAPTHIVVELQHNSNADMRSVCMGILVFFRRSMPDTVLKGKAGTHKLKLCAALGFDVGDGKPEAPRGVAAARGRGRGRGGARRVRPVRAKYEDNKGRAVAAVQKLVGVSRPEFATHAKRDDLADALLQGLWVLYEAIAPRAPVRRRRAGTQKNGAGSAACGAE